MGMQLYSFINSSLNLSECCGYRQLCVQTTEGCVFRVYWFISLLEIGGSSLNTFFPMPVYVQKPSAHFVPLHDEVYMSVKSLGSCMSGNGFADSALQRSACYLDY